MDSKFLMLLAANLILFLLIRFTRKRKKLSGFITFVFSILITLTVIEAGYRFFFKKKGLTETGNYGGSLNTPVDLTGFTVKNIKDLHAVRTDLNGNVLYDVVYTVAPDTGFNKLPINHRMGYRINEPSRDSVEIIFFGCSFTFATGVSDTATMAYRLGKELQYNTLNYGSPGWGIHQAYQVFTHKYRSIPDHKKRIFVYTFIPDHLLRAKCIYTWCLNDPYFEVKNDSLEFKGTAYKNAGPARSQVIVRLLSLNRALSFVSDIGNNIIQQNGATNVKDEDYRRGELMLNKMVETANQRGDKFIILHWDDYIGMKNPKGGYYIDPAKMSPIMEDLRTKGATVLPVSRFFDFSSKDNLIPQDNHPSGNGNALVARKLAEVIRGYP